MRITNWQITIPSITIVVCTFLAIGHGKNIAKIVRCQCKVSDPTAFVDVKCWSKSLNRTYAVANVRANINRVLDNISVNFQIFRKTGLNYRPFLVNVTEDYCAFFAKNKASKYFRILGSIYLPYTNLNHTCPYFGNVFIKDMPVITDKVPSIWPTGDYRLDVVCYASRQQLLTMEFFVEMKEYFLKQHP